MSIDSIWHKLSVFASSSTAGTFEVAEGEK